MTGAASKPRNEGWGVKQKKNSRPAASAVKGTNKLTMVSNITIFVAVTKSVTK